MITVMMIVVIIMMMIIVVIIIVDVRRLDHLQGAAKVNIALISVGLFQTSFRPLLFVALVSLALFQTSGTQQIRKFSTSELSTEETSALYAQRCKLRLQHISAPQNRGLSIYALCMNLACPCTPACAPLRQPHTWQAGWNHAIVLRKPRRCPNRSAHFHCCQLVSHSRHG